MLLNVLVVCDETLSPVVFTLLVAFHKYVEATLLVKGMFTAVPLQTVAAAELVIAGIGFTVAVIVCTVPAQPPNVAVGVTE